MHRYLNKFSEPAYALMRIVAGLLFLQHGAQKLFGLLGGFGDGGTAPLFSQMGLAGIIEFFGGLLIAFGLLASWAAFVASGEMAVAYFMAHAPQGFFPIQNRGELAALYCFMFLYVATRGAGIWSIDQAMGKKGGSGKTTQ
jgi:putative oxidoreductase